MKLIIDLEEAYTTRLKLSAPTGMNGAKSDLNIPLQIHGIDSGRNTNGCNSLKPIGTGASQFLQIPIRRYDIWTPLSTFARTNTMNTDTITGVTALNYVYEHTAGSKIRSPTGEIYGYRTPSNFTMVISGYFWPRRSVHTMVAEMFIMRLGTGGSCSGDASVDAIETHVALYKHSKTNTGTGNETNTMDLAPTDTPINTPNGCDSLSLSEPVPTSVSTNNGDMSYIKDPSFYSSTQSLDLGLHHRPINTRPGNETNTTELIPEETPNGCNSLKPIGTGAEVSFYKYPYEDMTYNEDPFSTFAKIQVQSVRFTGTITPSNFTMVISGFLAKKTGAYNFTMVAEDGTLLRLGTGGSCSGDASVDSIGNPRLLYKHSKSPTYNLKAGVYYPITFARALTGMANSNTPNGCDSLEFTGTGADVSFYKYPYGDMSYIRTPVSTLAHTKVWILGLHGVKALNYVYEHTAGYLNPGPTGEIYGYEITFQFYHGYFGYFLAKKMYNFIAGEDGTLLRLGTGRSCSGDALVDAMETHTLHCNHEKSNLQPQAGVYYPIKFVHVHSYRW
ncbi:hypothetical protein JCM33374_g6170 [Metschnikowia sp. JCM 33374]|nr:hypothetical protein JCM33374_g6170 [Metschnikowia sp. JCM 33374]